MELMKGVVRFSAVIVGLALSAGWFPSALTAKTLPTAARRGGAERLERYKGFLKKPDERRRYFKEYMDLFVYFNYDAGADWLLSDVKAARGVPVPRKAKPGLKKVDVAASARILQSSGAGPDPLARLVEAKTGEIGVPEALRRYLDVEDWEMNLDADPYPERIVSIRLSLSTANDQPAFPGDRCSKLQFAQILFLVDPSAGPDDFADVRTLSRQNRIENVCTCVGCLQSRLLDVIDADGDGSSEIIIVETVYDTVRYAVYARRPGGGYGLLSRHHYDDS